MIYEPLAERAVATDRRRLTCVLADAWNAEARQAPPELMGQLFHLFEAPNRFGLPRFYTLHAWRWKDEPDRAPS